MARYQRGWLRVVERKQGRMWQLRYNTVDPVNGKKKERATIVGSLADFPTESACWREVDRQRALPDTNTCFRCERRFKSRKISVISS